MAVPLPVTLTYGELYEDDALNPFGSETKAGYRAVFHSWRVETRPQTVERVLGDLVSEFFRLIGGIGVFFKDDESASGHLEVAHGIQPYHGIPGRHIQDRKIPFGFEGDVTGVDIPTVALDKSQWKITALVNISGTITRTLQILGAEPEDELLGPHKATDANVRTVKTRGGMYIPFEFMPLVLEKNLTAREAYLLLVPAIVDAGMEATCQPLIDWLTVAFTDPSAMAPETVNLKPCLGRLHFSPSPAVVSSRRAEVLYQDLPAINATPGGGGYPYLRDVVRAVGHFAVEARADRDDRHDRSTELAHPKGVREKFGDRLTYRFLLLCRVSDNDALPGVFHELLPGRRVFWSAMCSSRPCTRPSPPSV
jgi:hypothetical protein